MMDCLEAGAGIYRDKVGLAAANDRLAELRDRFEGIEVHDKSNVFNTDLTQALELRNMLDVAATVAVAAEAREESRGAHQRLDFSGRDDERFLRHSLVGLSAGGLEVNWRPVTITRSQPGVRNYSGKVPP